MINEIAKYFDLQSNERPNWPVGQSSTAKKAHVFPQYVALALGVLFQPIVNALIADGSYSLDFLHIAKRIIPSLIISIIILPGVYKNSFDPTKPISIQLCAIFTVGIGWQSAVAAITKTAGG